MHIASCRDMVCGQAKVLAASNQSSSSMSPADKLQKPISSVPGVVTISVLREGKCRITIESIVRVPITSRDEMLIKLLWITSNVSNLDPSESCSDASDVLHLNERRRSGLCKH